MKPYYYSLNEYIKKTYNTKMYKLSLSGGMSCPNRDGLIDNRGCIFCSAGGSGDFTGAAISKCADIDIQINTAKALVSKKYSGSDYIAYFQSYTNTYADVNYLRELFFNVIKRPEIKILSIATRPDCLDDNIIKLLAELNSIKPVWIELGLQTIHENTANYIRRGYCLDVFEDAVYRLNSIGIKPIVHMIIGLPNETESMMLDTARFISHCNIAGVKLQLLHILKNELTAKVKANVDKNQKDYIIREQLKVLNQELNGEEDGSEADEFLEEVEKLNASDEIKDKIRKEIKRYKVLAQGSSEANVERGYIETLLEMPWDNMSEDNNDLDKAEKILNKDHYGMKKVKDRILETLAVRNITSKSDAPIICLVGPPGTGKTSIARSVARALNKKYVRICLGGVRDEAEIRGHRKTYVGAMPGRIITGFKSAQVKNPLILLDEIDKISSDYKGDTASALLEVLDSEQNSQIGRASCRERV